jgi:hypothetical protein
LGRFLAVIVTYLFLEIARFKCLLKFPEDETFVSIEGEDGDVNVL